MSISPIKQLSAFVANIRQNPSILWKGRHVIIITGLAALAALYFIFNRMIELQKNLSSAQETIQKQNEAQAFGEQTILSLRNQLEGLKSVQPVQIHVEEDTPSLTEEINTLRSQIQKLSSANERLQKSLTDEKANNMALQLDLASQAQSSHADLSLNDPSLSTSNIDSSLLDSLRDELSKKEDCVRQLEKELGPLTNQLTDAKEALNKAREEVEQLKTELRADCSILKASSRNQRSHLETQIQTLTDEIDTLHATVEKFRTKNQDLQKALNSEEEKNRQLEQSRYDTGCQQATYKITLERLNEINASLQQELQITTELCTEQDKKIAILEQTLQQKHADSRLDLAEIPLSQGLTDEQIMTQETIRALIEQCQLSINIISKTLDSCTNMEELQSFIPSQLQLITTIIDSLTAPRPPSARRSAILTQTPLPSFVLRTTKPRYNPPASDFKSKRQSFDDSMISYDNSRTPHPKMRRFLDDSVL